MRGARRLFRGSQFLRRGPRGPLRVGQSAESPAVPEAGSSLLFIPDTEAASLGVPRTLQGPAGVILNVPLHPINPLSLQAGATQGGEGGGRLYSSPPALLTLFTARTLLWAEGCRPPTEEAVSRTPEEPRDAQAPGAPAADPHRQRSPELLGRPHVPLPCFYWGGVQESEVGATTLLPPRTE